MKIKNNNNDQSKYETDINHSLYNVVKFYQCLPQRQNMNVKVRNDVIENT